VSNARDAGWNRDAGDAAFALKRSVADGRDRIAISRRGYLHHTTRPVVTRNSDCTVVCDESELSQQNARQQESKDQQWTERLTQRDSRE